MRSSVRCGDCAMTRWGRTWRINRLMSRRSSSVGSNATVGEAEEVHVVHADHGRGLRLFVAPQRRHVRSGDAGLRAACVAVGHDAVRDVHAGVGQGGDHPGPAEVDIVGMGRDDEDSLDAREIERFHDARR